MARRTAGTWLIAAPVLVLEAAGRRPLAHAEPAPGDDLTEDNGSALAVPGARRSRCPVLGARGARRACQMPKAFG